MMGEEKVADARLGLIERLFSIVILACMGAGLLLGRSPRMPERRWSPSSPSGSF
jgi:hypothetical protein